MNSRITYFLFQISHKVPELYRFSSAQVVQPVSQVLVLYSEFTFSLFTLSSCSSVTMETVIFTCRYFEFS